MKKLGYSACLLTITAALLSAAAIADEGIPHYGLLDLGGYESRAPWTGLGPDPGAGAAWVLPRLLSRPGSSASAEGPGETSAPSTVHGPLSWQEAAGNGLSSSPSSEDHPITWDVSLGAFFRIITGVAISAPVGEDVDYSDLLRPGSGFHLQWRVNIPYDREGDEQSSLGPAILFDYVRFAGERWTDTAGDSLEPDEMQLTKLLAGIHYCGTIRGALGVFFARGLAGLGLAYFNTVDATLDLTGSGAPGDIFDVELFEATTTVAFELSVQIGAKWNVGTSAALGFYGFADFTFTGSPKEGEDFNDLDSGITRMVSFGIAFCVDFGRQDPGPGPDVP